MATRDYSIPAKGDRWKIIKWSGLSGGDTGQPYELAKFTNVSIHVKGTFNSGTLTIQGDNALASPGWAALNDAQGNALAFTAEKIERLLENVHQIRPSVSSLLVENCEDAWNEQAGTGVTSELDAVDFKVGSGSAKFTCLASTGLEIIGSEIINVASLADYTHIGMWIKSNVALDAGDLQLLLDNSALCASPLETLDIPAVAADTWTWVTMALSNPAAALSLISVGLKQAVDRGAMIVRLDGICAIVVTDLSVYIKVED